ncbi:MAG: class I SAM-dependent methyltransferase, partial [Alphaproteobacteria bacterium]|nr:class I SAM-dependent methyltransferase [Alphaproteobacteria bacterium]
MSRRLRLGLPTILGLAQRGFFIPHRYAAAVASAAPYGPITTLLEARADAFRAVLGDVVRYAAALDAIGPEPPPAPRWTQSWFPRLDAAVAYAMVRSERPARIVEVGSGHSTRFLARAVRDGGLSCALTAIDPAPRASVSGLAITVRRALLQDVGLAPFAALAAGDILFIDSSHILMPGTDVDILLNHVLPRLAPGVLIHVHDVFLPDDYPAAWRWRGYNEQQALAALLANGGDVTIEFASHYVVTRLAAAVREA